MDRKREMGGVGIEHVITLRHRNAPPHAAAQIPESQRFPSKKKDNKNQEKGGPDRFGTDRHSVRQLGIISYSVDSVGVRMSRESVGASARKQKSPSLPYRRVLKTVVPFSVPLRLPTHASGPHTARHQL